MSGSNHIFNQVLSMDDPERSSLAKTLMLAQVHPLESPRFAEQTLTRNDRQTRTNVPCF